VSSFDHEELLACKKVAPSIPLGVLLYGYPINTPEIARAIGAYSVHLNLEMITPKRVSTLHQAGLKVFVYTVNELSDIQAMRSVGVDGVFSDFPDRVIETNPR
jgi:glycerophosphoryl diester phosphodiesterase